MRARWRRFRCMVVVCGSALAWGAAVGMVDVTAGILRPFYPPTPQQTEIPVAAFALDAVPVTNGDFLRFVQKHPEWRRGVVDRLFADARYLEHWAGPLQLGPVARPRQPVTRVSWFAARAYCEAQGKRLPTENEWEYAAQASPHDPDARRDMAWRMQVLEWYARPAPVQILDVRHGVPNVWGVYDLHGLVWEWVLDFHNTMTVSDNRENADNPDKTRFCGAGAQYATEKEDYASFMRIAFRTSLQGRYTTGQLGFRCAHGGAAP